MLICALICACIGFNTCVHIGSLMTVSSKKDRDVPVFSINKEISGVLKGGVEFLLSSSLTARVCSPKAKFSPQHFIMLQ